MIGLILQLLSFGFGLFGWIKESQEAVIIAGILVGIIIVIGLTSGELKGLGLTIIVGLIGAILIAGPWWFGTIIAISLLDGLEAILSIILSGKSSEG